MTNDPMDALVRAAAARALQRRQPQARKPLRLQPLRTRVFISFDFDEMFFEAKALGQQLRDSSRF